MEKYTSKKESLSPNEAEMQIRTILTEIMMMGANGSEHNQIIDIIEKTRAGILVPEIAIQEARNIKDSKQAYH